MEKIYCFNLQNFTIEEVEGDFKFRDGKAVLHSGGRFVKTYTNWSEIRRVAEGKVRLAITKELEIRRRRVDILLKKLQSL